MKNRSEYPVDWFERIRPAVLQRDNYKCVRCKIAQRTKYYIEGGNVVRLLDNFMIDWASRNKKVVKICYLQIAHLNHNTHDNRIENLETNCPRCHKAADKAHDQLRKKMRR